MCLNPFLANMVRKFSIWHISKSKFISKLKKEYECGDNFVKYLITSYPFPPFKDIRFHKRLRLSNPVSQMGLPISTPKARIKLDIIQKTLLLSYRADPYCYDLWHIQTTKPSLAPNFALSSSSILYIHSNPKCQTGLKG